MSTDVKIPRAIAVVGCTASGKSALAMELCRRHGGELVSMDSMQVYRGMDIGTAKPTLLERAQVRHHMIDVVDPTESYSSGAYVEGAAAAIREIRARGKLPVLCGGTGLYLDGLLRGGYGENYADPALRAELEDFADAQGVLALHARLASLDPESAAAIHPNNVKRVIRAIEICTVSGQTKTELDKQSQSAQPMVDALVFGIRYGNREVLYDRIGKRVDVMLREGLVEETEQLLQAGVFEVNATAAGAIGYKEIVPYLQGHITLQQATEDLKTATRRYAKRQMTWFYAKPYVTWIDADADGKLRTFEEIVNICENACRDKGFLL
ncbi:MAG: tRNA (adenosine(37)-N6)-dimethylallyltransferase MiaA [Clostridia bacterium]|nr:tRNA (adenosine(37)-N6)-dimethylallyltransferase MiaA [Clostridia bacterium]